MHILSPTHLIWTAAAIVLAFASPTALALPPAGGPSAAPGAGAALLAAARPLPTLVPPENDAITSATTVTGLPFAAAVNTAEATTAVDDPFCSRDDAATVWYAWEAPATAWITADTFGSDYDTILSAYSESSGTLTQVGCSDDAGGGLQSQVTFLAEAGHVYYFMAAGAAGGGNLEFALEVVPPLPQLPVRATPHYEITPASGMGGFAWAQGARSGFRFWTLWLDGGSGPRVRVNPARTNGYSGGFAGDKLVYQEVRGSQSNLRLFDVDSHSRSTPAGVNTRYWEWHPTMSASHVLFGRRNFATRTDRVILRDRATGTSLVLDRLPRAGGPRIAESGQVNGNYAVWYRCAPSCNVFLRDIAAGTTSRIPNPQGRQQYSPSVAGDGTVYFVQSGRGCGTSVRLVRHPLGGPSTVIASLAPGRDSFHTHVEDDGGGSSFYFERIRCSNGAADIFRVVDP
jgi:hypothetical protein